MNSFNNQSLNDLWKTEKCPIINGVIFDNGTIIQLDIPDCSSEKTVLKVEKKMILSSLYLENKSIFKDLYHSSLIKKKGELKFMAGEGSWGGDGYVACINMNTNKILWIFTSDRINPIIGLELLEDHLLATNNNGCIFNIRIDYQKKRPNIVQYRREVK